MPSAADLFPRTATPRHGVQGVVQAAPADTDSLLSVDWEIDSEDGPETVGEPRVRWASNGRLPAVGDLAIMFTDGQGDTWAFVWATGAVLSASPAEVAAIETPEAVRLVGGVGQPAFAGSWVNYNGATVPAGFYRHLGRTYLSGLIKSGTLSTAAFTLPAGYWPPQTVEFPVESAGGFGAVFITAAGVVTPFVGTPASYISLDGIDFRNA